MAHIHKGIEITQMRQAGRLAAETLDLAETLIRPGITTKEIDDRLHQFVLERGGRPAPLGYTAGGQKSPFPGSCCTSVNNVVCHGIPGPQVLKDGDIVNVDVTPMTKQGWHGDTSATFLVGNVSDEAARLVEVTRRALEVGIQMVKPGTRFGDLGHAIDRFVAEHGYSVVREYTGHGIGQKFHTDPVVFHWGEPGTGPKMKRGMIFTIEPMVNLGGPGITHPDEWTVLTADGSLSAQFEHTVLVTKRGCEVLTRRKS